jgi:hypothetical protein
MGNYESLRIGATVDLEVIDALKPQDYERAEMYLAEALKKDINDAVDLLPGGSDSYILSWGNNA